jgi:hypothetical protein
LRILPILLATHLRPLSEGWDVFPQPVGVDLTTESYLSVEAATLLVLEENVFPHRTYATELGSIVGAYIDSKIIA